MVSSSVVSSSVSVSMVCFHLLCYRIFQPFSNDLVYVVALPIRCFEDSLRHVAFTLTLCFPYVWVLAKLTGFVGKRVAQVGGGLGAHDVVVVLCDCVSRFYSDPSTHTDITQNSESTEITEKSDTGIAGSKLDF